MPKLQAEDYDAPGVFRYSMRKFLRFSKDVVATYGKLTPEQYEALLAIKTLSDSTGLTIGKLGERHSRQSSGQIGGAKVSGKAASDARQTPSLHQTNQTR
jgi:hypothetical protein